MKNSSLYALLVSLLMPPLGSYLDQQLIPREPKIFFIASESDDLDYRFVITHPPKDGNQLMRLIIDHDISLNLPNRKYYLSYFKETRRSPRNFDSTKDIPTRCYVDKVEPSCMDNGDVIASIFNKYGGLDIKQIKSKRYYINKNGLKCTFIHIAKDDDKFSEDCQNSNNNNARYYYYPRNSEENIFGV